MSTNSSHGPLHQFEIQYLSDFGPVAGMNLNFSNASLFMLFAVILVTVFLAGGMRRSSLVPGRWQSLSEMSYEFVAKMLKENVGAAGRKYFPFIFTLFMFILACNLIGMIPYSFTVTSHIIVTFAFALFVFIAVTIIGFMKHGIGFLKFFLPSGTPWWMAPLMIFIEIVAYLARPVSLSVRLAANMMAGHTMLKVIASFVIGLGWWLGWLPFILLTVLVGFEIFVAILQAYIFAILVCVYLNDAVHMH